MRLPTLTRADLPAVTAGLGGSHGVDVTGGMAAKVNQALAFVEQTPGVEVLLCSGLAPGNVYAALTTTRPQMGTWVQA